MSAKLAATLVVCLAASHVAAEEASVRRGLFRTDRPQRSFQNVSKNNSANTTANAAADDNDDYSMLSLGTMFGVTGAFDDPSTFKVQNDIVVFDDERGKWRPAVYALPSINLWGSPGRSLAAIVPVNLNTAAQVNLGVGLSYGFNTGPKGSGKKSVEIGAAAVMIWSDTVRLSQAQERSFLNGTALPTGTPTEFRTAKRPAIGIGIYLVPLF